MRLRVWGNVPAMNVPDDLRYTKDHEWVRVEGGRVRIGITDYAQDALGDVVYVQVPDLGRKVGAGESFSEVESTKSVSDIYAPVTGEVVEANHDLVDATEEVSLGLDDIDAGAGVLLVKRGPGAGSRFVIDTDVTSAGRHPDSDIFLDDVTVSRRHAEIVRSAGQFAVRDVGSLNGT